MVNALLIQLCIGPSNSWDREHYVFGFSVCLCMSTYVRLYICASRQRLSPTRLELVGVEFNAPLDTI